MSLNANNAKFNFKSRIKGKLLKSKSEKELINAVEKAGLSWLDKMANGSSKVPEAPPIRWGVLAGSGSAFLGKKLIGSTKDSYPSGDPNESHSGKGGVLTFGFDAVYANRMHNDNLNPGPFSTQAGGNRNPGNQWLLQHLKGDKDDFMKEVAEFLKAKF